MSSSLQKDEDCSPVVCSRLFELQKMFMFMSLEASSPPACSLLNVLYTKALQLKFVCIQENNVGSGGCILTACSHRATAHLTQMLLIPQC